MATNRGRSRNTGIRNCERNRIQKISDKPYRVVVVYNQGTKGTQKEIGERVDGRVEAISRQTRLQSDRMNKEKPEKRNTREFWTARGIKQVEERLRKTSCGHSDRRSHILHRLILQGFGVFTDWFLMHLFSIRKIFLPLIFHGVF